MTVAAVTAVMSVAFVAVFASVAFVAVFVSVAFVTVVAVVWSFCLLFFSPEASGEEEDDGEYLESADEH